MNGDLPIKPASPTPPTPPAPSGPTEESGTRALDEALRSSFFIVKIIMGGLIILFLCSGFFTVKSNERAIVLRLGKPVGGANVLLGPGFHPGWPRPIDEVERIPFSSVQYADSTVGWYQSPQARIRGEALADESDVEPRATSYVLTSDTNIIHARAEVQYTITDPVQFHFGFTDAPGFITNALNNALLTTAAKFPVDDILTRRKEEYHEAVQQRFQELIDKEQLGIHIDQMVFDEAPPPYLKAQFEAVVEAAQTAGETRTKSETYAANAVNKARGDAFSRTNAADASRVKLVTHMAVEAQAFTNYLALYDQNPEFFERLRVSQTWSQILTNAQEILVQPSGTGQVRIQMSREPLEPPVTQ